MSWWELRARVQGQLAALGLPTAARAPSPEEFDEMKVRFADV